MLHCDGGNVFGRVPSQCRKISSPVQPGYVPARGIVPLGASYRCTRCQSRFGSYAAFQLSTAVGVVTAFFPKPDVPLVKRVMQANGSWAD